MPKAALQESGCRSLLSKAKATMTKKKRKEKNVGRKQTKKVDCTLVYQYIKCGYILNGSPGMTTGQFL